MKCALLQFSFSLIISGIEKNNKSNTADSHRVAFALASVMFLPEAELCIEGSITGGKNGMMV